MGPHASKLYVKIAANSMRTVNTPELQEISMQKWFAPVILSSSRCSHNFNVSRSSETLLELFRTN